MVRVQPVVVSILKAGKGSYDYITRETEAVCVYLFFLVPVLGRKKA